MVELYATTQEQVDQIMELIKLIRCSALTRVLWTSSTRRPRYISGLESAAETAAVIQNRVELYVNEQR